MKTMKKIAVILMAAMILVCTACGVDKTKALETYAQTEEWKTMISEAEAQAKAQGMTLETTVVGNSMTYNYILDDGSLGEDPDLAKLKEILDGEIEKQRSTVSNYAGDINKELGITDTKIKFVYTYEGSEITSADFAEETN